MNSPEEFPDQKFTHTITAEFIQRAPTEPPKVENPEVQLERIRAMTKGGEKALQLTKNQLVCNFIRLGQDYPGFSKLNNTAIDLLQRFSDVRGIERVDYAAIHYVDEIRIPFLDSESVDLTHYFTLGVEPPVDPFGNIVGFQIRTQLQPEDGTGPLEIQLKLDRPDRADRALKFRMDWHKWCPYDQAFDAAQLTEILNQGHESVMKCFRASFTEKAWQLFEPQG
ncbi:MAG: TIGR04255 family protein [Planctomycetales bacterium]